MITDAQSGFDLDYEEAGVGPPGGVRESVRSNLLLQYLSGTNPILIRESWLRTKRDIQKTPELVKP